MSERIHAVRCDRRNGGAWPDARCAQRFHCTGDGVNELGSAEGFAGAGLVDSDNDLRRARAVASWAQQVLCEVHLCLGEEAGAMHAFARDRNRALFPDDLCVLPDRPPEVGGVFDAEVVERCVVGAYGRIKRRQSLPEARE